MKAQQTSEVEAYNDALTLICETAKINQETFMKTYGNEEPGKDTTKNELIIFMTPRIMNQEEAGLSERQAQTPAQSKEI